MTKQVFEATLGVAEPWFVAYVDFEEDGKILTIRVDFRHGSRFVVADTEGIHPLHGTVTKRYRRLKFLQHECFLEVRVPRVRLPDGSVRHCQATPTLAH